MKQLTCTCRRERSVISGFERSDPVEHDRHRCPYAAIVQGLADVACHCCPLCTILCLPRKTHRARADLRDCYEQAMPMMTKEGAEGGAGGPIGG